MAPASGTGLGDTNGASSFTVPLVINGKETVTSTTFSVISPATKKPVWSSASAGKQEALAAIAAAQAAFPAWSSTKPTVRRDIFLRAAQLLDERSEEAKKIMQEETAAADVFGTFNVNTTAGQIRDVASRIVGAVGGTVQTCQEQGTSALVLKEPYGVVFSIAPW